MANTDTYSDFLADFTGKPKAELEPALGRKRYFTPAAAKDFGLIDKVITSGSGLQREKKDYEAQLQREQGATRSARGPAMAGRGGGDE